MSDTRIVALAVLGALAGACAIEASAASVIEIQFNDATNQVLGGTLALSTPVSGASTVATLSRSGTTANPSYYASSTGIDAAQWQSFLASGYLQTQTGGYNSSGGLVTTNNSSGFYSKYLGFSGYGTGQYSSGADAGRDKGGTISLIFRPGSSTWGTGTAQKTLFGTGYNGGKANSGGYMQLYEKSGALYFQTYRGETGSSGHNVAIDLNGDGDNLDIARSEISITPASNYWDPGKWYFVSASWRTGSVPVLYMRELASGSAVLSGISTAAVSPQTNGTADAIIMTNVPTGTEPNAQPIAFGSSWYDPGGGAAPSYGLGGDIAYARIDNVPSSTADMDAVFQSLQVPEPSALTVLAVGVTGLLGRRRAGTRRPS